MVLYLINLLDSFNVALLSLFLISVLVLLALGNMYSLLLPNESIDDFVLKFGKAIKLAATVAISTLIIQIIIPSEKTCYLMLAAKYLDKSEIPSKIEIIIHKKLDKYLEDIR